jgi:hypothetical protein
MYEVSYDVSINSAVSFTNILKCCTLKYQEGHEAGHVAHMGERRGAFRNFVGKCEGKRPLGTLRHRCEGNIKMDLTEIR